MCGLCTLKGSNASTLSWNAENFQGILLQGAAELICISQRHIVFCACPQHSEFCSANLCISKAHCIKREDSTKPLYILSLSQQIITPEDKGLRVIWKYDNVDIKIKVLSEESFSGNYGLGFELKMKGELVSQTIISSLHILVDLVNILNILHV